MTLSPDLIILCSLIALLMVYGLIKLINTGTSFKQRKDAILETFQKERQTSKRIQSQLSNYILANNAHKNILFENVTCGEFLKQLQKNHILNLSDKQYVKIKNSDNRLFLKRASQELKLQELKLKDAESKIAGL